MATQAVDERIRALIQEAGVGGTVGVAAHKLGTSEQIMLNPDTVFPTASSFKVVLLYTLYRLADAGTVDLGARVALEERHRVPGSGVLQDLDAGAVLTVKDIATLMIVMSDNSATDMTYDLVGREAVQQSLDRLDMPHTHLPLGCWGILAGLRDLDPNDPDLTYAELKRRLGEEEGSWDCAALAETPENNVSTPRDMLRLMEGINAGEGLSAGSRAAVIDILLRQKISDRIPALLPFGVRAAHKTGSVKGVRNDVGLIFAGETTYALALMSKGAQDEYEVTQLLARISRAIYDAFAGAPATDPA